MGVICSLERGLSLLLKVWLMDKDSVLDLHHHPGAWSWTEEEIQISTLWQEQGQVPELCQDRELEDKGQRGSKWDK